jgi:hypothetical protein
MPDDLLLAFHSPCGHYELTFDDDGKVAYAYLKHGKNIVGDVWLYNRCPTPEQPEWTDRKNIPFANCKGYMSEQGRVMTEVAPSDVNVDWEYEDDKPVAHVYVFQDLYGVVGVGEMPGYARYATKDSGLARVMDIEE